MILMNRQKKEPIEIFKLFKVKSMRASCSSELIDDFDDFNEKPLYCPSTNSISLRNDISNNDFPFDDEFCDEILKKEEYSSKERLKTNISKTIEYDQQLANLISNELGLNDPQTSRKNAWGNLSYAELITKAILNSEQQRLTLSQIYSWIILYVPYFRDKSDKKSSQGWKNSIRHNLSLHNRFVRIPNEIAGKSSWWTIDLRAKLNRGRKKNLSNENSTKKTCKSSFTSVRDFNQSFYSNLQNQTNPNILHDMLKSSSSQISNQNFNNRIDCEYSSNLNHEDDQIKLKNKLKTMDRSNPLFRRMFLKLMRIQMNENKLNNQRNDILSTPPPSSIQFNNLNSTLDFDIQTILHFEQTTFGDDIFDIQDLPNL